MTGSGGRQTDGVEDPQVWEPNCPTTGAGRRVGGIDTKTGFPVESVGGVLGSSGSGVVFIILVRTRAPASLLQAAQTRTQVHGGAVRPDDQAAAWSLRGHFLSSPRPRNGRREGRRPRFLPASPGRPPRRRSTREVRGAGRGGHCVAMAAPGPSCSALLGPAAKAPPLAEPGPFPGTRSRRRGFQTCDGALGTPGLCAAVYRCSLPGRIPLPPPPRGES